MTQPPSYRQRRQRRVRIIAAVLAVSLAAPPLLVVLPALKAFGAGIALLIGIAAAGYFTRAGRRSRDQDR